MDYPDDSFDLAVGEATQATTPSSLIRGLVADWDTLRDGGDGRNACAGLYGDLYGQLRSADRVYCEGIEIADHAPSPLREADTQG